MTTMLVFEFIKFDRLWLKGDLHSRIAGVNDVQPLEAENNISFFALPAASVVRTSVPLKPTLFQDRPSDSFFIAHQAQSGEDPAHPVL